MAITMIGVFNHGYLTSGFTVDRTGAQEGPLSISCSSRHGRDYLRRAEHFVRSGLPFGKHLVIDSASFFDSKPDPSALAAE